MISGRYHARRKSVASSRMHRRTRTGVSTGPPSRSNSVSRASGNEDGQEQAECTNGDAFGTETDLPVGTIGCDTEKLREIEDKLEKGELSGKDQVQVPLERKNSATGESSSLSVDELTSAVEKLGSRRYVSNFDEELACYNDDPDSDE